PVTVCAEDMVPTSPNEEYYDTEDLPGNKVLQVTDFPDDVYVDSVPTDQNEDGQPDTEVFVPEEKNAEGVVTLQPGERYVLITETTETTVTTPGQPAGTQPVDDLVETLDDVVETTVGDVTVTIFEVPEDGVPTPVFVGPTESILKESQPEQPGDNAPVETFGPTVVTISKRPAGEPEPTEIVFCEKPTTPTTAPTPTTSATTAPTTSGPPPTTRETCEDMTEMTSFLVTPDSIDVQPAGGSVSFTEDGIVLNYPSSADGNVVIEVYMPVEGTLILTKLTGDFISYQIELPTEGNSVAVSDVTGKNVLLPGDASIFKEEYDEGYIVFSFRVTPGVAGTITVEKLIVCSIPQEDLCRISKENVEAELGFSLTDNAFGLTRDGQEIDLGPLVYITDGITIKGYCYECECKGNNVLECTKENCDTCPTLGPWSECSAECGAGQRTRSTDEIGVPDTCNTTETEDCFSQCTTTPAPCLSAWSDWSPCQGCVQRRTRDCTPECVAAGTCPDDSRTQETRACPCTTTPTTPRSTLECAENEVFACRTNRMACEETCVAYRAGCEVGQWEDWSPCSATCGPGVKSRSRVVSGNCNDIPDEETEVCDIPCECEDGETRYFEESCEEAVCIMGQFEVNEIVCEEVEYDCNNDTHVMIDDPENPCCQICIEIKYPCRPVQQEVISLNYTSPVLNAVCVSEPISISRCEGSCAPSSQTMQYMTDNNGIFQLVDDAGSCECCKPNVVTRTVDFDCGGVKETRDVPEIASCECMACAG
ncbi:hypothetical protein BaRGS_00002745, partial [Batillaria attramentaria]